jgi:hypothetical protein
MLRALALFSLFLSGCATATTLMQVTGADDLLWNDPVSGRSETPESPLEQRVSISLAYDPPAPIVAATAPGAAQPVEIAQPGPPPGVPPPPGSWAPMPPEPRPLPPPAPVPVGSAHLRCTVERRYPKVKVRQFETKFDVGWKLLAGFLGVGDVTGAWVGISESRNPAAHDRGASLGIGIFLAADALGTIFWLTRPVQSRVQTYDGEGSWAPSDGCPANMSVEIGGERFGVAPDGHLDGSGDGELLAQMLAPEGGFTLSIGGRAQLLSPSDAQRCAWLRAAGLAPCFAPSETPEFGALLPLDTPAPEQALAR